MKHNTLKVIALMLIMAIAVCSLASCGSNSTDDYTSSPTPAKKSLSERKEIAEEAVAEYINDYMRTYANTGKYSIIDYSNMRYSASSSASGNVFTVKIEIYHYDSYGKCVGKNKSTIKASAKVDEYGKVSDVEALSFMAVSWY